MKIARYQKYLQQFVHEAMAHTNGSATDIRDYLREQKVGRWFVRDKEEKTRALDDARRAFEEHRHWPLNIILSHLGVPEKTHEQ